MDPAEALHAQFQVFWNLFFQWFIPGALILSGLGTWLKDALARFKGVAGEKTVANLLSRVAEDVRTDVLLPNGRGGWTQVDHLALMPSGIWVVETKNYQGRIFGQARQKTWTQKLGRHKNPFQNPLHQNYGHLKALETSLPDTPIHGLVVFSNQARFPKGRPEGVVQARDLASYLQEAGDGGTVPLTLQAKWDALAHRIRTDPETRKAHLAQVGGLSRQQLIRWLAVAQLAVGALFFIGSRVVL